MGAQPLHRMTTQRALATWLALVVLFWQTLLSSGAIDRLMAPVQIGEAGLVICTEHGMQTLPPGDGTPAHDPADHSAPSCPCCLSFAVANATILPATTVVAAPDWVKAPQLVSVRAAFAPPLLPAGPLQPRAPPVSV